MRTKIQPNGSKDSYEVVWSGAMRVGAVVLASLLVAAVSGIFAMWRVTIELRKDIQYLGVVVTDHVQDRGKHEDGEVKLRRIQDYVDRAIQQHVRELPQEARR